MDWGKGKALAHMLKALSLDDCDDVIPIYLGDDRTDEDAFKILKDRAAGFGILISNKVESPLCLWTVCIYPGITVLASTGQSSAASSASDA